VTSAGAAKTPAAKAPPQFSLLNPARRGENGYRSCRRRSPSEENRWRRRGFNATPAAPRYPSAADRRQAGGKLQATDKDGRYPRNREHATSAPRGLVFPQISPFPLGIPVGPIILDLVFFHFFFFGAMGLDHKFTTILAWIFFFEKNILPW